MLHTYAFSEVPSLRMLIEKMDLLPVDLICLTDNYSSGLTGNSYTYLYMSLLKHQSDNTWEKQTEAITLVCFN